MSELMSHSFRTSVLFAMLTFNALASGETAEGTEYSIAFFFDSTGSTSIVITSETAISTNFTNNLVQKHGVMENMDSPTLLIRNHVEGRSFWIGQLRATSDLPHIIRGDTQRGLIGSPDFKVVLENGVLCLGLSSNDSLCDCVSSSFEPGDCKCITLISEAGFVEAIGGILCQDRKVFRIPCNVSFRVKMRLAAKGEASPERSKGSGGQNKGGQNKGVRTQ